MSKENQIKMCLNQYLDIESTMSITLAWLLGGYKRIV